MHCFVHLTLTLGTFIIAGACLSAQSFTFTDFSSFWYATPQPVINGFDTVFTFRITPAGTPADGMTFCLHNDPAGTAALGASGGALGYQGFSTLFNSVVVEFDTYANGDFGETVPNVVSVHANGSGPTGCHEAQSIGSIQPPGLLANGQARQARVEYLPVPGTLNVYLDNLVTPLISIPYSFATGGTYASSGFPVVAPNLAGGMAYVGFTGGTGGLAEINAVESWTWGSAPVSVLTLAISQPMGPGSVSVQVTNGIPGAFYVTAISFDALNASNPGSGWWGGLHISLYDLITQVNFNLPPFVGNLDGGGASSFILPAGLPGGIPLLYSVTRTFAAGFAAITATSNIVAVQLL
jgi:hypothetical protein